LDDKRRKEDKKSPVTSHETLKKTADMQFLEAAAERHSTISRPATAGSS
jgi:hypothetical protein